MSSTDQALSPGRLAQSGLCVGCGACAVVTGSLSMRLDRYGQFKPRGPGTSVANSEVAQTCPFSPAARDETRIAEEHFPHASHQDDRIGRYEAAYIGHAEGGFREEGSSGGLTNWLACELLRLGLVDGVAHVGPGETAAGEALFGYRISRTEADVRRRAKSRYFPVELSGVLDEIKDVPGRYAIVGIPCFIKAVHLLRAVDPVFRERIVYTLGLFCGHMKSARFAESIAGQLGYDMQDVSRFEFRTKDTARPANWYRAEAVGHDGEQRARDWWHLVDGDWGAGFFQNSACDFCDDVVAETADVSFGDAWIDPYQADGRGTNVIVVRDRLLHRLLADANRTGRVALQPVEADVVVRTQAAGFRHRREGLAYRLAARHGGIQPIKRVAPRRRGISIRRRSIYAARRAISRWSARMYWLAHTLHQPRLYRSWAVLCLRGYQALAHSRGGLGRILDRLLGTDAKTTATGLGETSRQQ
ncbi:MAG TPA: Coenzyme F420 hydrogenase/dehydrogenase, beta subunit C-terminal domain [Devosia sp.]